MEDVEDLLLRIEQEISEGKKPFFGGGVIVDGEAIYALTEKIRAAMPDVVREARYIVQNGERRQQEETFRAQSIIRAAQERAAAILSDHDIIRQAQAEADSIRAEAKEFSERLRESVLRDIETLLSDTEKSLEESITIIRKAKGQ